jgi:hypothetical protein
MPSNASGLLGQKTRVNFSRAGLSVRAAPTPHIGFMISSNHHDRCDGLNNGAQVLRQQARQPGPINDLTTIIEKMAQIYNEGVAHVVADTSQPHRTGLTLLFGADPLLSLYIKLLDSLFDLTSRLICVQP